MQINIKSNRSFVVKIYLPFIIFGLISIIAMGVGLIVNYQGTKDTGPILLAFSIGEVVLVALVLLAKFYKGKSYSFFKDRIIVYNKGKFNKEISLENIVCMSYYKFKFRYIITIFAGALNEGSCWRLYLKFKDGSKINIACFSIKDIQKLKELYSELITIF